MHFQCRQQEKNIHTVILVATKFSEIVRSHKLEGLSQSYIVALSRGGIESKHTVCSSNIYLFNCNATNLCLS